MQREKLAVEDSRTLQMLATSIPCSLEAPENSLNDGTTEEYCRKKAVRRRAELEAVRLRSSPDFKETAQLRMSGDHLVGGKCRVR